MDGRRNRRRGAMTEREIVNMLRDAGIAAEKISRSGYIGPDLRIQDEFTAEVKHRKGGMSILTRWLAGVDMLFIREAQKREPIVVMPYHVLVRLLGGNNETD